MFRELKKREVINIADGQSLGHVVDVTLSFPKGVLVGISVPARKRGGLLSFFDRSTLYIEECKILKIGSDVILVDVNCGNVCAPSINLNSGKVDKKHPCPPKNLPECPPKQCCDGEFSIFKDVQCRDNDDF